MNAMVSAMIVRRATEHDLPEVLLLERETATAPHWAAAEYARMLEGGGGGLRRAMFVATEGRVITGFAVGKLVGSGPDAEAELESVVVRAEERRQGLGSALCRAVIAWSRAQGAAAITLEVRVGSGGAVKLYGGLGFVAAGRRPRYYQDPPEDAVVMRCGLSRAGAEKVQKDEEPGLFE